jgi:hypothetical protein
MSDRKTIDEESRPDQRAALEALELLLAFYRNKGRSRQAEGYRTGAPAFEWRVERPAASQALELSPRSLRQAV